MTKAYYNEFDPFAAQWLRNLIAAGHIAPGDVDSRSIEDVKPSDLVGYTQCHFFAGIGIWSAALRGAGWPDDRPVWTGSCPCQPFSTAGKGKGLADERHLWPAWLHLIKHGKGAGVPVFGEQVASDDGLAWLDIVRTDMEGEGYTVRPFDLCAAGVGAPHIRQRLFFVAMADARRLGRAGRGDVGDVGDVGEAPIGTEGEAPERERRGDAIDNSLIDDRLANSGHDERGGWDTVRSSDGEYGSAEGAREGAGAERQREEHVPVVRSAGDGVADADQGQRGRVADGKERQFHGSASRWQQSDSEPQSGSELCGSGPTNSFWGIADWLFCKDGKWRPVEPSTQPLVDGTSLVVGRMQPRLEQLGVDPGTAARILGRRDSALAAAGRNRVGRLKGYGNAINKEVAQAFIKAVINLDGNGDSQEQ